MNPIMQSLQRSSPQQNNISQLYRAYQMSQNPRGYINQLLQSNPMLAQIAGRGNLKEQFYNLCSQRGVNPEDILKQFK